MEEKLNIANILKDKPISTKLYADAFGELSLECVNLSKDNSIYVKTKTFNCCSFYSDGKYTKEGEPILVPSKEMRDWYKFAWKKGDVLVSNDGCIEVIFDRWYDDTYTSFYGKHYLDSENENDIVYIEAFICTTERFSLEDKESFLCYINTIEKRLGGKLNHETLEIEKQTEFKDGDIVFADYGNRQDIFIVSDKTDLSEGYSSFISLDLNSLTLSIGCRTTFFKKDLCKLRLATEAEKQQLFSSLKKEGKAWDIEKKMLVDLKPKVELKPFDKVLVRDFGSQAWQVSLFSYKDSDSYYCCNGCGWNQCIPYNGNESLLGITKDVEG